MKKNGLLILPLTPTSRKNLLKRWGLQSRTPIQATNIIAALEAEASNRHRTTEEER